MQIIVTQAQGQVPVTVITIEGDLDASSYRDLIQKAQELIAAGTRYILTEMSAITFISSAGIVALHTIALMLRGEKLPDPESGWDSLRSIDRDRDSGMQKYLKFLNPSPPADKILNMTGFKKLFEIHTDLSTAVASFDL